MPDMDHYRCPECGETIEGETVVDPGFGLKVDAHKLTHVPPEVREIAAREAITRFLAALDEAGGSITFLSLSERFPRSRLPDGVSAYQMLERLKDEVARSA